jgi:osmotically-inducible protein OsmY
LGGVPEHDSATNPCAVSATVKDAKVTLSDSAVLWQQRNLFADVASTVPGVKAVENVVSIELAKARPEPEIVADVKQRIANDVWLDGTALCVTVNERAVQLMGVVGSAAQAIHILETARRTGRSAATECGRDGRHQGKPSEHGPVA